MHVISSRSGPFPDPSSPLRALCFDLEVPSDRPIVTSSQARSGRNTVQIADISCVTLGHRPRFGELEPVDNTLWREREKPFVVRTIRCEGAWGHRPRSVRVHTTPRGRGVHCFIEVCAMWPTAFGTLTPLELSQERAQHNACIRQFTTDPKVE